MSYIIDQRKILFWQKALNCDNKVIRILAIMHKCGIDLILSKYCIPSLNMRASYIKEHMWEHFVDVTKMAKYSSVNLHHLSCIF